MLHKPNAGVLPTYIRYQSGVEKVTSFNLFSFDLVRGFEGQDNCMAKINGHGIWMGRKPIKTLIFAIQIRVLRAEIAIDKEIADWVSQGNINVN